MNVKVELKKYFHPFNLEIRIDNLDELLEFYHRINVDFYEFESAGLLAHQVLKPKNPKNLDLLRKELYRLIPD